jgi:hypothetical protein
MAQPEQQAQPQMPPDFAPEKRVLGSPLRKEVQKGPQGGTILVLHNVVRGEMILVPFADDEEADRISKELKPARVALPSNGAGLVIP